MKQHLPYISLNQLKLTLSCFSFFLFIILSSTACEDDPKAPTAVIAPIEQAVPVRAWLSLNGEGSLRPGGNASELEYHWQLKLKPNGSEATFNDQKLMNPAIYLDLIGDYELSLIVKDGKLSSAEVSMTVKAGPCGAQAPILGDLTQYPVSPGVGSLVELFVPATDPDLSTACGNMADSEFIESGTAPFRIERSNYALEYQWRLLSRPVGSVAALLDDQSLTPRLVPDASGTYLFEVTAKDQNGDQAEAKLYTIEVSACGEAVPRIEEIRQQSSALVVNTPISFIATVIDADEAEGCAQAQSFSYQWRFTSVPAGSLVNLNDTTLAAPSFVPDFPGSYQLSLVVTDQSGKASTPFEFSLEISNCGTKAPVISEIMVNEPVRVTELVRLNAIVSDMDSSDQGCQIDQRLFYQWSIVALPAGSQASLNQNDAISPSLLIDRSGEYQVRLQVSDAQGNQSTPFDFSFTVGECGAFIPQGTIVFAPAIPVSGKPVALKVNISDEDVNCGLLPTHRVLWSLNAVPAGSQSTLNDRDSLTPSFMADLPGNYELSVQITDNSQLSKTVNISIPVSECGSHAPMINAIDHLPINPGVGEQVVLNADAIDEDHLDDCVSLQINANHDLYDLHHSGGFQGGDMGGNAGGMMGGNAGGMMGGNAGGTMGGNADLGGDPMLVLPAPPALFYHWRLISAPAGASFSISDSLSVLAFTPSKSGRYRFELVVTDETQKSSPPMIHEVLVGSCGEARPEIIDLRASLVAPKPRVPFQLIADIVDIDEQCGDADNYRYQWSLVEVPVGSQVQILQPTLASPSMIADLPGRYVVRCTITDPRGLQSFKDLNIDVDACGSFTPIIRSIDMSLSPTTDTPYVGSTIELIATVDDQDLSIVGCEVDPRLSYQWSFIAKPAGSLSDMSDAQESTPSFTADQAGDYVIRLRVTDAEGFTSIAFDKILTIDECGGRAPLASASYLPEAPKSGDLITLTLNASDLDVDCMTPVLSYSWRLIEMPAGSRAVLQQPLSITPSFRADLPGVYRLIAIATDESNRSSEPVFVNITVDECGSHAPQINQALITQSPLLLNAGQKIEINASQAVSDADTLCGIVEEFQYQWHISQAPAGSLVMLSLGDTANPSLTADLPGDYELTLTVSDRRGFMSNQGTYRFSVGACGQAAPVVSINANTLQPNTGGLVYLSAVVSDADRVTPCQDPDIYRYDWRFDQIPAGSRASFNESKAQTPSFEADMPGIYIVQVVVEDSRSMQSQPATLQMIASPCGSNPPSITSVSSPTLNPRVNFPISFALTVSDADTEVGCGLNQGLTYQWQIIQAPAGSEAQLFNADTMRPSFTPTVAGEFVVEATVTDTTGLSSRQSFTVLVSSCGAQIPSISANASALTINTLGVIQLSSTVTDADNLAPCSLNQSFQYDWQLLSRPIASDAQIQGNGFANAQLIPDVPGDYVVSVIVSDSNGLSSREFIMNPITASSCGSAKPVIQSISTSPASLVLGKAVQLIPSVTDADSQAPCALAQSFRYQWRIKQVPAGSLVTLNQSEIEAPSFIPDTAGTYAFELVVTDQNQHVSQVFEKLVNLGSCGLQAPNAVIQMTSPANLPSGSNVNRGLIAQLNASASNDPDSLCGVISNLSYHWILLRTPPASNATLTLGTGLTPWFTVDAVGTYVVRLVVSDGLFNSAATDFTINGI